MNSEQLLIDGILELGLAADKYKVDHLIAYIQLLQKWNKVYSLTAITDTRHIITHHILDGLTVVPYISDASSIIDIGSGMGVPGVVLAIWNSHQKITLLDSNQKKCAFLKQVAIELGLKNVIVQNIRVEEYKPDMGFDIVISRAFANTPLFITLSSHLLTTGGYFLAMKSRIQEKTFNCMSIKVKIPGIDDERVLLKCTK